MTPSAIPLLGVVTKHEHDMAATGIKTPGTPDPGNWGKLKEGAVPG